MGNKKITNLSSKDRTGNGHSCPTCFEWTQLVIASLIPIVIAIYTFVQNSNDQTIAIANRENDLKIAESQRTKDLQIAEDKQKALILSEYERFLFGYLHRYGMSLNESQLVIFIIRFKTLTTLNQLDGARKTHVLRSLYEAKLITQDKNTIDFDTSSGMISMEDADLSDIRVNYGTLKYLSLTKANLTRATFNYVDLSCINFRSAILSNSNFNRALILKIRNFCFPMANTFSQTNFRDAIMDHAEFYRAEFIAVDFSGATLFRAKMHHFLCIDCFFHNTHMHLTDLSSARISMGSYFEKSNLTETILESTYFLLTNVTETVLRCIQGMGIKIDQCILVRLHLINCTFSRSIITQSNFSNVNFTLVNWDKSTLNDVIFTNILMHQTDFSDSVFNRCIFIDTNFGNAVLTNASFINCVFQRVLISKNQKLQAATFHRSTFL